MANLELAQFFLNTPSNTVRLKTFEISHPNFSKVYRIVQNHAFGFTGTDGRSYEYYPLGSEPATSSDDLDFEIRFDFGDLGEIIPVEIDNIASAGGFYTKPTVIYREYQTSPTGNPFLLITVNLEVTTITQGWSAASITAKAPRVSDSLFGYRYTIKQFPPLAGFT